MTRIVRLGFVAFAVLCATAWLFAQAVTVTRNVNLRADPSTDHPPIRLLLPNEPPLTLVDPTPQSGFYHVKTSTGEDGWVWGMNVSIGVAPVTPTPGGGTEAFPNPACPPVGMHQSSGKLVAYDATSDAGLRNAAKRHIPAGTTPATLTLFDFDTLQQDINEVWADARTTKTQFTPNREALLDLPTTTTGVSEGDLVQLVAYVTMARDEGNESVNCGGVDGHDIHIAVGDQGATEYEGIVVEMIPQLPRPNGWDSITLNRLHASNLQVLIVGGLTYDNEHFVNSDPAHPKSGQPKRMSLWEIHPITEFYVCTNPGGCDPGQHGLWKTLTEWASSTSH